MQRLVGVWRLVRWSARLPDGTTAYPFGEEPRGTLVYTADGTMIASFMAGARTPLGLSMAEIAACRREWLGLASTGLDTTAARKRFVDAALQFNSYTGRYTVEGDRVHHDVEIALFPDWIGKRQTRRYELDGDRLALITDAAQQDRLEWQRR